MRKPWNVNVYTGKGLEYRIEQNLIYEARSGYSLYATNSGYFHINAPIFIFSEISTL